MICRKKPIAVACVLALTLANSAYAQQSTVDAKIEALQKQIEALKAEVNSKADISQVQQASSSPGISMKPGDDLTFRIGDKSEVQIYGHVDVSYDTQTNGLHNAVGATGNNGYVQDVSSNLSFFGIRGNRILSDDLKGLFQFETEVFYAATPGASDQAPDGTAQKTGLGSRNSYVGLQSATFGAVKLGKTDSPYKTSTARMDPFANSVADYNSIMGNSGGDSRTEFDTRLPHSIWYESPKWNGWSLNALLSPGQNRSTDGQAYALGEPDCSGGNSVGPQNPLNGCNDGAFKTAYSGAVVYELGPLYATAAYELHKSVNRGGDDNAPGSVGIADEAAYKLGLQYVFPTKTTANLIFERMKRDAITSSEDERTRNGTWLAITQKLSAFDELNFGWAHAFKTPGQPVSSPPNLAGQTTTGSVDNSADQFSIGFKHFLEDKRTSMYVVATDLKNGKFAHYAIGAGGHGIVTRDWTGDQSAISGGDEKALSVGLTYDF